MANDNLKQTKNQAADRNYEAFARDNKAWHDKVEKSIRKIGAATRSSSGRISA